MSSASIKTLKEIILDEQRLVTYISLAKELCMHVNQVKILLEEFIEDIRKTRPDVVLNVQYIVAGLLEGNRARVTVCSETQLKETLSSLKCVYFQHVYSILQGLGSVDNATLVSTNDFEDLPLCIGLIKGKTCLKRSSDEIGTLKTNSQGAIEEPKVSIPQKDIESKIKSEIKKNDVTKVQETKPEPTVNIKSENTKKKEVQRSKINEAVSNGIAGFFSRANSTPSTKNKSSDNVNKDNSVIKRADKKTEVKIEAMDIDETEDNFINGMELDKSKSEVKDQLTSISNLDEKNKVTKTSSKPKKEKSDIIMKNNAKVDKTRKRVLQVSDSESDEDKNDPFADECFGKQDSDDEIPPTPSTRTVKITSGIVNPRKKRKIVDKTYTDEEGYILTRKEEVFESCSDNEEDKSTKENIMMHNHVKTPVSPAQIKGKTSKKKISPPQKGKQASIMSFFKKN